MRQQAWSEELEGSRVHFQLIDYGVQVLVWAGQVPNMQSLYVAVPARAGLPSVTSLLDANSSDVDAATFSKRLCAAPKAFQMRHCLRLCETTSIHADWCACAGQVVQRPVAVSWNVEGDQLLQVCFKATKSYEFSKLQGRNLRSLEARANPQRGQRPRCDGGHHLQEVGEVCRPKRRRHWCTR
jgi:Proteasome assembly chaperone 4